MRSTGWRATGEGGAGRAEAIPGAGVGEVQVVPVDTGSGNGVPALAETAARVIEQARTGEKITALPLKRWWEDYVIGALAVWAITRL